MKVFDRLIRVSKASIVEKLFDVDTSKLSKKELKKVQPFLPTEEEADFMHVYRSNLPELARLQRKMSVCLLVEVKELEEEKVSFMYGRDTFTLTDPVDSFRIATALDRDNGTLEAVAEMAAQKSILKNGQPVENVKAGGLKIDELKTVQDVASRFFFQTFLTSRKTGE